MEKTTMTQKEFITMAMGFNQDDAEYQAKGKAMLEALSKRKSSPSKKKMAEVEEMKANVLAFVTENPGLKAKEIAVGMGLAAADGTPATQKVSAYLTKLIADGVIERRKEKKDIRFYLLDTEGEEA